MRSQIGADVPAGDVVLLDAVGQAGRGFAEVVRTLSPPSWRRSTPCPGWHVANLVAHVVSLTDGLVPLSQGNLSPAQVMSDELYGPTHTAERLLLGIERGVDAWAGEDLATLRDLPWGRDPGRRWLELLLVELLGHGWDLGVAVGRPHRVPPKVVAVGIDVVQQHLMGWRREPHFAPVVTDDVPSEPLDRLAALLGRRNTPDDRANATMGRRADQDSQR